MGISISKVSFSGRSDILLTHPNNSCRGNPLKVKNIKHKKTQRFSSKRWNMLSPVPAARAAFSASAAC